MDERALRAELDSIRCDLSAATYLIEVLFVHGYRRSPERFANLAAALRQQVGSVVPGVDPAFADHTADSTLQSLSETLARIQACLDRAHRGSREKPCARHARNAGGDCRL